MYSFATDFASFVAKRTPSNETESAWTKRHAPTMGAVLRISAATNASAVNAPGNRTGPAVARAASIRPSARAPPIIARKTATAFVERTCGPSVFTTAASPRPKHESNDETALFEATAGSKACIV